MARLAELGAVLVGCRVVGRQRWEQAVRAGAGDPARALAALADDPPDWWDGTPPVPPGLTDYQRAAIEARLAAGELCQLGRDLALNQFLLLDKLGQGAQGAVYRARQLNPPRFVAVKTLVRDTDRGRRRFEQEARALLRVRHPAVARFHLYERVRDGAGEPTDEYLIAMEFVAGTDLGRLVRRAGPVPWPFAVRWAADLLGGLAEIHRHGFVHRDVKPENVMTVGPRPGPGVRPEDTAARLLDFGAVQAVGGDDGVEGGRVFVGTREYAPPEQWAGKAVPASDLYALGGTLFAAITSRAPYRAPGRDPVALQAAHTNDPVPDARERNPDVPAELSRLLRRMMAKAPADRGTAAGLVDEFRRLSPAADDPRPRPVPVAAPAPKPRPVVRPAPAREPRHPVARALDPVLALLERLFIPGHHRPPPGEEPPVPERLVALLRRPPVLVLLAALLVGLVLWAR